MRTRKISLKDIRQTLHADLIGKDSQRGITLTYGWFANQVGHFALGFIPSFIVYQVTQNANKACVSVGVFWLLFEIYNALSPLYKPEYKGNKSFKLQWLNLVFDTFTDLCFFWLGSIGLLLMIQFKIEIFIFLTVGLFLLFFSIRYWFLTKLFQQNARFPYQFRLSQWNLSITKENIDKVENVLGDYNEKKHLIVLGNKGSGKTSLAVGLANELAIKHQKVTYTTFSKWIALLQENTPNEFSKTRLLWNWRQSELLVIDDINPGIIEEANKFTASDVWHFIQSNHGNLNVHSLQNQSVLWVLGTFAPNDDLENWFDLFKKMGLDENQLEIINLN